MINLFLSLAVSVVCSATQVPAAHSSLPVGDGVCLDFTAYDTQKKSLSAANEILEADELRRARNKIAAKKCRAKRKQRETAEQAEKTQLITENAQLRAENATLRALVAQMQQQPGAMAPTAAPTTQVISQKDMETADFADFLSMSQYESEEQTGSKRTKHSHFAAEADLSTCFPTAAVAVAALATTTISKSQYSDYQTASSDSDYSSSGDSSSPKGSSSEDFSDNNRKEGELELNDLDFSLDDVDLANIELDTTFLGNC